MVLILEQLAPRTFECWRRPLRVGDRMQNRKVGLHSRNMLAIETPLHRVQGKRHSRTPREWRVLVSRLVCILLLLAQTSDRSASLCFCVCGYEKQNPHFSPSLPPIWLYRAPLHIALILQEKAKYKYSPLILIFPFLKIFYYKDMSDEPTIIFRAIQCVIVEEKTVITFIWNLWPCSALHWIASSNITLFPGLCFSLSSYHSHGTHCDLSLNQRFSSASHIHHPKTLICSLTCWKVSYSEAKADFSVLQENLLFLLPGTVKCERHPAQHKEAAEDLSGTRLLSGSLCCSLLH